MKPNREELERAIKRLKFFKTVRGYWDNAADVAEIETALTVLRAALDREANEPLTKEELAEMVDKPIFVVYKSKLDATIVRKWSIPYMVENGAAHCTDGENWYPAPNCHIYRYEPKGEPNV